MGDFLSRQVSSNLSTLKWQGDIVLRRIIASDSNFIDPGSDQHIVVVMVMNASQMLGKKSRVSRVKSHNLPNYNFSSLLMLFYGVYILEFWLGSILSFINFQLQQLGEFIVMIINELRHGVHHFLIK